MKHKTLLIIIALLTLVSCSKSLDKIKEEEDSIRGVVKLIEPDTFTMESSDRKRQGDIIVTKRVEHKKGDIDFREGDTITVYYKNIEGSMPARINHVYAIEMNIEATDEEHMIIVNVGKDSELNDKEVDYYEMPKLTVVDEKGNSYELSEANSAFVRDLLDSLTWEEGSSDKFVSQYKIMDGVEVLADFNFDEGMLNDVESDISIVLQKNISIELKKVLMKGGE